MALQGAFLFLLSLAALLAVSWWVSGRLAARPADRAWIALAAGAMLLGAISLACSAVKLYTPAGFLGTQALLSLAALGIARAAGRRPGWRLADETEGGGLLTQPEPMRPTEWAMLVTIVLMLTLSAVERWITPLHNFDDLMYHGSRAAYWVQNQSVFPYETHNDRQTTFPFGAELIFAWPLMFTHSDLPGRMMHWLAVPLATAGVFSVARAAGAARPAALFAALLYVVTPAVMNFASTLKADIWAPVWVLGAAYWIARAAVAPASAVTRLFWAGVMTALAMNVKVIIAAMIPALALAPFLIIPWPLAARAFVATGCGGLLATLLSGLAILLVYNATNHGHPLGPEYIRKIVQPDYSLRQTYTHAVRLPMFLIDLPENPSESARRWMRDAGNDVIEFLGADEPLAKEEQLHWPGRFLFDAPSTAGHFGLGGMLWLPLLGAGTVILVLEVIRSLPRIRLSPTSLLTLVQLPLLLSVVFMIRWMGAGPDRFWLAPYALSLGLGLAILTRWSRAHTAIAALAILGAVAAAYPAIRTGVHRAEQRLARPHRQPYRFAAALAEIPAGSTILLVGTWNAQDYPLMAPEGRLVNRVVPWGRQPFEPARLAAMLEEHQVRFVFFENERNVWLGGQVVAPTADMVRWLLDVPGARSIDLEADQLMRLIEISGTP